MYKSFLTTYLIVLTLFGFAQQKEIAFDKSNFPTKKKEFKEAKKNLQIGTVYYDNNLYSQAIPFLLKANDFNANSNALNLKLGISYFEVRKTELAARHLKKAIDLNPNIDGYAHYLLARTYHLNEQWKEAMTTYKLAKKKPSQINNTISIMVVKRLKECQYGRMLSTTPLDVTIENLGDQINTEFAEYCPLISADESIIIYTARRDKTTGKGKDPQIDDYFEDLYISEKKDSTWQMAKNIGSPINSDGHDATVALSADGQQLLVYRADGDIYQCNLMGNKWTEPKKLNENINTEFHEPSACFSPDGKSLYFVSDKPGGFGGTDIYVSYLTDQGEWGKAYNLGKTVNTDKDEEAVFLHPDGKTLYFSSKGHRTIGGYDIFKTVKMGKNWTKPKNIGYPINTPNDDAFFVISADGKHAYYASIQQGGFGEKDIYRVTFPQDTTLHEPDLTILKGVINGFKTKLPLETKMLIIDNEKNETIAEFYSNTTTGKYLIALPGGKNYGIVVTKKGYIFHSENVNIPLKSGYQEIIKDIELKKLEIGQSITLKNIFYDYNKASLRPESVSELERLTELLNDNPTMKIEISSHTDSRGSDDYNLKLSQRRAKSVVDYLIAHGISKDRLIHKGYGELKPVYDSAYIDPLTNKEDIEKAHQDNRRTEFIILNI